MECTLRRRKVQADKSTIARSTQSNTDSTDAKRYSFTIVYIVVQKPDPHCIITFPYYRFDMN
jgi:hypothetical protein